MKSPIFRSAILIPLFAVLSTTAVAEPLTPEESLGKMDLEPGFTMEVFASEPEVVDPVALTFDAAGSVFVAEMREMEILPALEPGTQATIRRLEDTDGDGRMDRSTVFAEGLSFPSGLVPYRSGILALCTPDLLYLEDTDKDGKADIKQTLLTGFAQGNAEHRFNNLTWGLDNWVHAANGHGGGVVFSPEEPEGEKIDLSGRDLRYDPFHQIAQTVTRNLPGGFGLTFDDWGRRFVCHNEQHAMHVILDDRYLRRNPQLAVSRTSENIAADGRIDSEVYPISQPQQWRIERTTRRAKEMADKFRDSQLKVNGYFTAACGVTVYRAELFPEKYQGSLFVCDAAQNLVHRSTLEEEGTSMRAHRADEKREFLRSSDQWFRPVNLEVGPDGALYVLDFYREIIETAQSIPEDILAKIDLRAGSEHGRVYRIVPAESSSPYLPENLAALDSAALVAKLSHPNAWHRLTAQRLLIEREAKDVIPQLREEAQDQPESLGRLHALWTLEGLNGLDETTILSGLEDSHPRIREHALLLSERLLASANSMAESDRN